MNEVDVRKKVLIQARRGRLSAGEYVDGVLGGDRAVLARAITLVESSLASDGDIAAEVVERCLPHAGRSRRIGITGVPGVGKSTLVEALGNYITEERRETLAVLAVDPSSPISGGSILGDKTRMGRLACSELAFIRPSPSRGCLGGVTFRTREAMLLCEAAGFRNVIIETVGTGQRETAVRSMVDFLLLLVLAGAGDDLQFMKRGILEMADMIAVTKADGENRPPAERARREYETALHGWRTGQNSWNPPVAAISSFGGDGVPGIWQTILDHRAFEEQSGRFERRRSSQALEWMNEALLCRLQQDCESEAAVDSGLDTVRQDVLAGKISAIRAAQEVLSRLRNRSR